MHLEGKFPEWVATFEKISLDDLSINKLMSCPILNQTMDNMLLIHFLASDAEL